jgi:D-sedoheptulose 7-phosphate isomerase
MNDYITHITREIEENAAMLADLADSCSAQIIEAVEAILLCLRAGGKIIVFGNGGSAVEAQHFVAELVGRYRIDRLPFAAVALTADSASLTAIANDYGFEQVFSRQLLALARPNDIAFAISTSGNSPNIIHALESARNLGLVTIGLTGRTGGKLAKRAHICLNAPSNSTPRIQEAHTLLVHVLCGIVENAFVATARPHHELKSVTGEVR